MYTDFFVYFPNGISEIDSREEYEPKAIMLTKLFRSSFDNYASSPEQKIILPKLYYVTGSLVFCFSIAGWATFSPRLQFLIFFALIVH